MCFFYFYCLEVTTPKDKTKPTCKPTTPAANVRAILRIFKRYGLQVIEYAFLKTVMQGVCNMYVQRHGPEAFMPKRKQPLTVKIIVDMLNVKEGTSLGPLGKVRHDTLLWDSIVAAFEFAAQTGARAAEVGTDTTKLTVADYTFAHVKWNLQSQLWRHPSAEQLGAITSLDFASVTPTVSKADQRGEVWVPFPIYLPYRGTAAINAARAIRKLELEYPPTASREATPLFRNNNGQPLTIAQLRTAFKHLIFAVLPTHEASKYSLHSFRIFLATALKDAGADDLLIQYMVHWATTESLRTYCRMQPKRAGSWLDKALTANIDPQAVSTIPVIDNHRTIASAMDWAKSKEPMEPDIDEEPTETIQTGLPVFTVGSFTWQHTAVQSNNNTPHGVLYETVTAATQDMTPSREWVYCKPGSGRRTHGWDPVWEFTLNRHKGLQPKTKLPWGPPSIELTEVTQFVTCAICKQRPSHKSTCLHTRIQVDPKDMPVQVPSQLPLAQLGTQTQ
jgi:hypothetical protein